MPVTSLHVTEVGPFDEVSLTFDQEVNVFTGPNNSGKSTLLSVLGELLVYPFGIPTKLLRSDKPEWGMSLLSSTDVDSYKGTLPSEVDELLPILQEIGYTCFVPAQRHGTNFRSSGPTTSKNIDAIVEEHLDLFARERPEILRDVGLEALRQNLRKTRDSERNPELARRVKLMLAGSSLVSDTAVKQKIIDLDYAAHRTNRPEIKAVINVVTSVASEITEGFPIQFIGVSEDSEGLYPKFRTPDGDLPLDVLSQGTQSILQILSRLLFGYAEYYDFPPDLGEKPGIMIIDEIDAHLHPTWQGRVIPTLTRHFPNLQIFCSTHSPLILAGLKTGQVQLLRRNENTKVTITRNDSDIAGWTADEILRQFLEVANPTDTVTAQRIKRLQELMSKEEPSSAEVDEMNQLRKTVRDDLLSGPTSVQVLRFAEELRRLQGNSIPTTPGSAVVQETSQES